MVGCMKTRVWWPKAFKKKKPNSWKYCLWSDWSKSSNLGWNKKYVIVGVRKTKRRRRMGIRRKDWSEERLNEVESKSCVWIAWGCGWQVEAVLGQPGWSWISPRYQQHTHTHTRTHIHTNNHNRLALQLWVCYTTQQAWQQAAGVALESVIWTHQGDIN